MGYTKKGSKTRELILDYAKKYFYEIGYNDTWIKNISSESGIALGNITYYFKKKDDIVTEIYGSLMKKIDNRIIFSYPEIRAFERAFLSEVIFYHIINSCENNKRFYYEIIQKESNRRVLFESLENHYMLINDALDYPLSESDFHNIVLADIGVHHEILLSYFENRTDCSLDYLIRFMLKVTCRNFELSESQSDNIIEKVFEYYGEIDASGLILLV